MLLFSFSIFSDHRSLKIENEKNSTKHKTQKFDHRSFIYRIIGTQEQVLVWQGKRTIRVRAIEVLLNMETSPREIILIIKYFSLFSKGATGRGKNSLSQGANSFL